MQKGMSCRLLNNVSTYCYESVNASRTHIVPCNGKQEQRWDVAIVNITLFSPHSINMDNISFEELPKIGENIVIQIIHKAYGHFLAAECGQQPVFLDIPGERKPDSTHLKIKFLDGKSHAFEIVHMDTS